MEQAGLRQASVSEHLNKMRRAGIIKAIRKGREVWYRIEDPRALTLLNCLRKAGGKS
jgi:DNA-binding transcriptional ArsR family regulator